MTTRPDQSLDTLELSGIGTRFQEEIREHLDELELTRDLERKEQDCLAGLLRIYAVPADHVLFAEGDPAGYFALLLEGRMSVSKRRDDSGTCALYTLSPGKVFGEMALLDQEPRSASVTALTDCQIAVLTRDHFQRLCEGRSLLAVKLLLGLGRTLSQRLRRASGQLVDYL